MALNHLINSLAEGTMWLLLIILLGSVILKTPLISCLSHIHGDFWTEVLHFLCMNQIASPPFFSIRTLGTIKYMILKIVN